MDLDNWKEERRNSKLATFWQPVIIFLSELFTSICVFSFCIYSWREIEHLLIFYNMSILLSIWARGILNLFVTKIEFSSWKIKKNQIVEHNRLNNDQSFIQNSSIQNDQYYYLWKTIIFLELNALHYIKPICCWSTFDISFQKNFF